MRDEMRGDGIRMVRSSGNEDFKKIRKLLRSARERRNEGVAVLEGAKLVAAYGRALGAPRRLYCSESAWRGRPAVKEAFAAGAGDIVLLKDSLFDSLSGLSSPAGIMALIEVPPAAPLSDEGSAVMLDGLQDPGNLGTILRSAAGAGVTQIYLSAATADPWSPKSLRAGMGAQFHLSIRSDVDLLALAEKRGGTMLLLDHEAGTSLYDLDLRGDITFLVGGEGKGVSEELRARAAWRGAIPMPGWGEPLNAAVAASICLFEAVRQRRDG